VSAQPLKPVYLLTGSDRPKVERALQRLRSRVGEEGVEHLSAASANAEDAVAACNALGFFTGEARLVIVDEVERWKKADLDTLAGYLQSPAPQTVLALVGEGVKDSDPLAKLCAKAGQLLSFSVTKRDLPKWVTEQFRLAGVRAEPDAGAALINLVGDDLTALATEVEKLATWAGDEPIGAAEVEQLVAATADTPTFALTDAWASREAGVALEASETMLEREGRPRRDTVPRLAAALGAHLGRMRQLRRLVAAGASPRDAAQRLKLHPFYGEKVYRQSEGFSDRELMQSIERLAELDHALKGGSRLSPDLEFQRALIELARSPAGHGSRAGAAGPGEAD
jgi:DNA polymerase III subunit delta